MEVRQNNRKTDIFSLLSKNLFVRSKFTFSYKLSTTPTTVYQDLRPAALGPQELQQISNDTCKNIQSQKKENQILSATKEKITCCHLQKKPYVPVIVETRNHVFKQTRDYDRVM